MSKTTGILVTFENGDRHIITAAPAVQEQYFASLTRWFDELAHDGDHDHERFTRIRIRRNYSFDPTTVRAEQVWPDMVSYLAQYEVDANPEKDELDEHFASLIDEPYPMFEPLNVVNTHGAPNGDGTYTYLASCDIVIALMLNRNGRTGRIDPELPVMPVIEYGFFGSNIHRPTPGCSSVDSESPTCPVALADLTQFREASLRHHNGDDTEDDA